jgi:hypothetical protein
MDVEHGLPAVCAGVHDETEAALFDTFLFGKLSRSCDEMSHKLFVSRFKGIDRFDVPVRYDQYMRRRGGLNVAEGGYLIVAVDNIPRDFIGNDLTKDARV